MSWERSIRSVLVPHDLTHVQFVLLASLWWLESHHEPPTQARLASQAGTDPMMTSQVTRKLEARGLLERAVDPADARARRLVLTRAGLALVARALTDVEASDDEYFAPLGDRRQSMLEALAVLGDASLKRSATRRRPDKERSRR